MEANKALGIKAAHHLLVPGMRQALYRHQPGAVHFVKEQQKSPLRGSLECDLTGTGKTIVIIAAIQSNLNERRVITNIKVRNRELSAPKPVLLVAPNNLVLQWRKEITANAPQLKCIVYYSGYTDKARSVKVVVLPQKSFALDGKHEIFKTSESNAVHVVITIGRYFSNKHGPNAQKKWLWSAKRMKVKMHEDDNEADEGAWCLS